MLASAPDLARYLTDNPGAVIETVAGERDVTEPGIYNHSPGLWIPGSRARARAPE